MSNLQKYSSYKESGVEWIGEIPEEWEIKKLKFQTINLDGKRIPLSGAEREGISGIYPYYGAAGIIDYIDRYIFNGEYILIGEDGSPFFDKTKNVSFIAHGKFWVNNHCHILKSNKHGNNKFIMYSLNAVDYTNYIKGSTRDKLNQSELSSIVIPYPSMSEQTKIASYLDTKTVQIDQAISQKEQLIELLKERRHILINDAVTKGLNPNVPMKESGVEWIGEIPEHWDTLSNRYIFTIKKDLVGKKSSEYDLLSLTLQGIIKRDMENPQGKFPAEFDTYQEVKQGDFVFCLFDVEETPRTVGLSQYDGMITSAYTVMSVDKLDKNYLYYFYLNLDNNKRLKPLYKGLRNTISKDSFFSFKTFVPPKSEQIAIASYLDTKTAQIDQAINLQQNYIDKLKEYKATLIDSVVTGKVRVV